MEITERDVIHVKKPQGSYALAHKRQADLTAKASGADYINFGVGVCLGVVSLDFSLPVVNGFLTFSPRFQVFRTIYNGFRGTGFCKHVVLLGLDQRLCRRL